MSVLLSKQGLSLPHFRVVRMEVEKDLERLSGHLERLTGQLSGKQALEAGELGVAIDLGRSGAGLGDNARGTEDPSLLPPHGLLSVLRLWNHFRLSGRRLEGSAPRAGEALIQFPQPLTDEGDHRPLPFKVS